MKFTIDKNILLKALDRAKSVTDSKGPMPILSHVHIDADVDALLGSLHISATDLFIAIKTTVSANVDEEGSICLNAKDLYDRLKLMPDGDVKFSLDGTKVTIKAGKGARKYVQQGLPAVDYPTIPSATGNDPGVKFNDRELADKIDSTIYAVSQDATRPYLNALLFEENNGKLNLVSTDGHRLAVLRVFSEDSNKWLIPLNAVKEISKLCKESASNNGSDHSVVFYNEGNNIFVNVNGFVFSCKLVDGAFPPYKMLIPSSWDREIKVSRDKLINSLRALAVSTGDSKGVKLVFGDNKLTINAESSSGSGDDEIECDYSGKEVTYGINAMYMIDAIEPICTDNVVLKLAGELDQVLIEEDKKVNKDSDEYIAIVMPMRV